MAKLTAKLLVVLEEQAASKVTNQACVCVYVWGHDDLGVHVFFGVYVCGCIHVDFDF